MCRMCHVKVVRFRPLSTAMSLMVLPCVSDGDREDQPRARLRATERHRPALAGPVGERQGPRDQRLKCRILPAQRDTQAAVLVPEPAAEAQQGAGTVVDGCRLAAAVRRRAPGLHGRFHTRAGRPERTPQSRWPGPKSMHVAPAPEIPEDRGVAGSAARQERCLNAGVEAPASSVDNMRRSAAHRNRRNVPQAKRPPFPVRRALAGQSG